MKVYSGYDASRLSPYTFGSDAPLWWGFVIMIAIESTVFATLVASYYYIRLDQPQWPPPGIKTPDLLMPTIGTLVLLASAVPMHLADKGVRRGDQRLLKAGLAVSVVLAAGFLILKYIEYSGVEYRWDSHPYGSAVWVIIGFHTAHVLALILKTIVVMALAWRGFFNEERRLGVTANGLYWHFVVAVWVPLYLVLYWTPRAL